MAIRYQVIASTPEVSIFLIYDDVSNDITGIRKSVNGNCKVKIDFSTNLSGTLLSNEETSDISKDLSLSSSVKRSVVKHKVTGKTIYGNPLNSSISVSVTRPSLGTGIG